MGAPHECLTPCRARWYLLRHAQPLIDAGVCYGQLDVPADAQATQDAAQAFAQHLLATWGKNTPAAASHLWVQVSPLARCQQLGEALQVLLSASGVHAQWQTHPQLTEMHFGTWEGQPWQQIPPAQWQQWTQDFAHHTPGGGESTWQFVQRVAAAARATAQWLQQHPQTVAIWITHAGVMRALHWLQHHGPTPPTAPGQWPQDGACACGHWLALDAAAIHTLAGMDAA